MTLQAHESYMVKDGVKEIAGFYRAFSVRGKPFVVMLRNHDNNWDSIGPAMSFTIDSDEDAEWDEYEDVNPVAAARERAIEWVHFLADLYLQGQKESQ